jgi:DNA-binding beta-propeller fold protein YncE
MVDGPYFLVSGRWDNNVALVSLAHALDPANYGTSGAIVSRPRVTPDIEEHGGRVPASGQPVSIAVTAAGDLAFVVNHSGRVTPAEAAAFQHGHPGTITVLDLAKAFDPLSDATLNAVELIVPTGTAGPVGCALAPNQRYLAVTSAEAPGREDGGCTVTLFDIERRLVARQIAQPLRRQGATPSPHAAPHASFGAFPDSNGIAISARHGGLLFTANGGTDDVSVISLAAALDDRSDTEITRVPVEVGPFGIAVSPDGRLVAVASRESARIGIEGRTVSLIDVDRAASGITEAEVARVLVGTGNAEEPTRPFGVAFVPNGTQIVATAFRSNTVSLIDVAQALAGGGEVARLSLSTPGGGPSRPRGVAITPDGRYAAVVGAAKGAPRSSMLWIVALETMSVAGLVTGVGNESYFLDVLPARPAYPESMPLQPNR